MIDIYPYKSSSNRYEWNSFVQESVNATFLLDRDYMDYHKDRFSDSSLVLTKKSKVIGLFPANSSKSNSCIWSHQGLTYGGLIISKETSSSDVFEMLDAVCNYFSSKGFNSMIYKEIPSIYHLYPCSAEQYWLFRSHAILKSRAISSTVLLDEPVPFSTLRLRKIKKALSTGLCINLYDSLNLKHFWDLLIENLLQNHHTSPVHTFQEILHLKNMFPSSIHFHSVCGASKNLLGGCIVYETKNVAHIQYIATNQDGRNNGALDLLFHEITKHYKEKGLKYLDYGISTENDGNVLNKGLLFQKEGFGGRAICYDSYEINL